MDFFYSISAAALMVVVFFFIIFSFSTLLNHLLQQKNYLKNLPPTPPSSLPIVGHLHFLKKPLHRSLSALSTLYGPILYLRFGRRPVLVVSSSAFAEDCLSKSDVIFANRPRLLAGKHLGFNYTGIGAASYGNHWRNLRRLATVELLCTHRIQELSAIRAEVVRSLLKSLFHDWEAGKSVTDLRSRFSELAFNAMMGMIADKHYYGENDVGGELEGKRFRRLVRETSNLSGVTNLGDFLPVLGWVDFVGVVKRMRRLVKERDELLQGLINEKLRDRKKKDEISSVGKQGGVKKKKETLIEVLLSLQEKDPDYYSDPIIKGMIAALLGAGTDTSSLTMEWAMALLLNHPQVLEKAKAELNMQVGDGRLLEESDLSDLPYLRCIINETLRLYPVTPLLLPHESSEETTVGGFTVPAKTLLLVNAWAIHRDPKVWEDDPHEFKPERFQGVDVGKEGCKFVAFGHGRRACPGAGLAMKMMGLALGSLIQSFEWERVGGEKVDMSEGAGLTIPRTQPLEAVYKPRESMISILSRL